MHLFMHVFSQHGGIFDTKNASGSQVLGKHDEILRTCDHGRWKQNALDAKLLRRSSDGLAGGFPAFVLKVLPVLSFRFGKKWLQDGDVMWVGEIEQFLKFHRERNEDAGQWLACL